MQHCKHECNNIITNTKLYSIRQKNIKFHIRLIIFILNNPALYIYITIFQLLIYEKLQDYKF